MSNPKKKMIYMNIWREKMELARYHGNAGSEFPPPKPTDETIVLEREYSGRGHIWGKSLPTIWSYEFK